MIDEKITLSKEHQILAAAEKEFVNKGFDGARTTSIAKAAGVTHAMLHYYFRTKEHLFDKVIEKKTNEIIPLLTYLFGNERLPLIDRIKEAISVHFDFVMANPDIPKFLLNEVLPYKDRCDVFKTKIHSVLRAFSKLQKEVDEAALRGEVEQFNVLLLFQSIFSLNIFTSLMSQFVENIFSEVIEGYDSLYAARKAENVEMIMRRITKK